MSVSAAREKVLILGGGDGLAAREILKYPDVKQVVLVDIDPAMTELGRNHPIFLELNRSSLRDARVQIINEDAYRYLQEESQIFDVIIIDLPDPKTVELARLYTREFYQLAMRHLSKGGALVTQASSPFFSRNAFLCIFKTIRAAGFSAIAYHNHIPTMGEWGWVLGINLADIETETLKERISLLNFAGLQTRFLNQDAMTAMVRFGKGELDGITEIQINQELELKLFHYYKEGKWDIY